MNHANLRADNVHALFTCLRVFTRPWEQDILRFYDDESCVVDMYVCGI